MTAGQPPPHDRNELRRRAERRVGRPGDAQAPSQSDTARLLHELQVHQIELELQNEELVASRARVEASQAELAASERRFRDTFEQAAVGIAHVAPDGRWLRTNHKLCEIVGYSAAQLGGMTYQDITHPDDLAADLHLAQRVAARDIGSYTLEKRYLHGDGRVVWIELTAALVRDESGAPDYFIAVVADIDARRAAEAARDEAQQRIAGLVGSAMDAIIGIDEAHHIVLFNPAAEALFGWRQGDVIGQPLDRLLPVSARAAHHAHIERFVATGTTSRRVGALSALRGVRADGTEFPIEASISQTRVAGKPFCTVILRDISERQGSDAQLQQAARQYRQLFDANPQPMWIYDLLTLRFLAVNDAAVAHYGWRRDEFLAMTLEDILPTEELPALHLALANVRAGLPLLAVLYRHRLKDGRLVDVELNAQPIAFGGRMARVVQAQDVTARHHAAQQVLESRESLRALLQRLQRAQEDERVRVAREVHDELGQMLTGLKMDLRWIERRLAEPGLAANQQPLLDRAVAASALNEETIAAVQKLSAELRPAALDQLGLGAALAQRARQFQQRTGVTCKVASADDLPPLPAAMASELFYIAQEALTNVARHAQAQHVDIRLRLQDAAVWLEIEDDGVGITPAALADTRSLGLLGMRERALLSRGTVQIDAAQPHGTRVLVRVPLAQPPP